MFDEEFKIATSGLTPEQRQEALRITGYAATNLLEFVAEAMAFATSPNSAERSKVSNKAIQMIAPYLGFSYERLMSILGRRA